MIRLIASDMDGTLLDPDKNFPPDFFDILDRLEKYNIKFVVASGRSYSALKPLFKERTDKMTFICDNGAFNVVDGKITGVNGIPDNKLKEIISACKKYLPDVHLVLCGMNGTYISEEFNRQSEEELGFYYFTRTVLNDLLDVNDTIFKIAIFDKKDPSENSFPVLNRLFKDSVELQISGSCWMDIMNPGVCKGAGLSILQKELGISRSETMAFGDFYNDISLLEQAEYSYVMENANDDMKKYGKYIAKSNAEYGVTKTISEYLSQLEKQNF